MSPHETQLKQQGRQAFERKDYAAALGIFQGILADHPEYADIRHFAGLCLVFMGRPEEALEQLDAALAINPAYVEANINRALVLQELGRYDEARVAFERASEYEQQSHGRFPAAATARLANAHAGVGDLYMETGAPGEAAAQYYMALELRPKFHDIRNKYATALLGMGRLDEAVQQLRRVLEGNPHFIAARLNLGLALYRQGSVAEAAEEWEACREQQPAHPQVRAYLAMLERVRAGAADD
ncbi:MAG TPA: tetratricopeptide repeat protein [Longimicrobiales bacterium]